MVSAERDQDPSATRAFTDRRCIDLDSQALLCKIIDDVQGTEPSTIGQAIKYEIHWPALIGRYGGRLDLSLDASDSFPLASSDCQTRLLIDAEQSLVIDDPAFALDQHMQPPIAIAPLLGGPCNASASGASLLRQVIK